MAEGTFARLRRLEAERAAQSAPGAESTPVQPEPQAEPAPVPITPVQAAPRAKIERQPVQAAPEAKIAPDSESTPVSVAPGADSAPGVALTAMPEKPDNFKMVEFTRVPHRIFDGALSHLNPTTRGVYLQLLRLSLGSNRSTCQVSIKGLAEREGIGERTAQLAIKALVASGYVERIVHVTSTGAADPMGMTYRVHLPPGVGFTPRSDEPGAGFAPSRKATPARVAVMKESPKEGKKEMYRVRAIALRLVPIGGALDVEELRVALRGQGIEWDDAVVEEAISVLEK